MVLERRICAIQNGGGKVDPACTVCENRVRLGDEKDIYRIGEINRQKIDRYSLRANHLGADLHGNRRRSAARIRR